jgi:hypothetical protein
VWDEERRGKRRVVFICVWKSPTVIITVSPLCVKRRGQGTIICCLDGVLGQTEIIHSSRRAIFVFERTAEGAGSHYITSFTFLEAGAGTIIACSPRFFSQREMRDVERRRWKPWVVYMYSEDLQSSLCLPSLLVERRQ